MKAQFVLAALLLAPLPLAAAAAQPPAAADRTVRGTRLDIVATGEVSRVPDVARIGAGVVTAAPTAAAAIEQNARQMASVRAALKRAGIADRDIQTSAINLFPDYRQDERGQAPPVITGYRASNEVTVTFRDIAGTGKILDALVAQGANQINGPTLSIDKPDAALDEARTKALAAARARADLYAHALGKQVGRIVSVSESGGNAATPGPIAYRMAAQSASTNVDAGEQILSVTLSVSFELD
ncbi:MAG TPA: SIMPL domain-containing protein [Allosphingosinicella sp.]